MHLTEHLVVLTAVTLTYVTFFVILIPLEIYFVYINACHLSQGEWLVPGTSFLVLVLYVSYFILTKQAPFDGNGAPMKLLRNSFLYKIAAKYRPTTIHKTVDLPSDKQYIFGVHPHSTIPTFVSIGIMTEGCEFSQIFPGITRRALAASTNFIFPLWREVYLWLGYVDASKKSAQNVLRKGSKTTNFFERLLTVNEGHSVVVLVGGEQEMIKAKPNENILCLRNRKGFVRLALESGAHLVPVFAFKANDCYSPLYGLERLNKYLSKKFRVVLPFVYGVWGTPWPRQIPVDIVFGAPIPVTKNISYTNKEVDQLHALYMNRLIELYEEHKERFGSTERKLIIVDAE